jgi:hypothetical protein
MNHNAVNQKAQRRELPLPLCPSCAFVVKYLDNRGCSKTSVFGTVSLNVGCFVSLKSLLHKDLRLRNSKASGKTMGFWNWLNTFSCYAALAGCNS